MRYRGMIALFVASCAVHIGGTALDVEGWVPPVAGGFALALLAGYVITAPSGDPGGVSGRARALISGGLLAVAVSIIAAWQLRADDRSVLPPADVYAPILQAGRADRAAAIALVVALGAFLLGIAGLPRDRRGGFLTAGLAMAAVFGVAVLFSLVVPLHTLPLLFGGPVRAVLSLLAAYAIAVFLLLRAARRRGFPVGVAGVLLAAGAGAVLLRLTELRESVESAEALITPQEGFLHPGLEISAAVSMAPAPVWAGPEVTLQAALMMAGPLLIVAGALGVSRRGHPPDLAGTA